MTQTAASPASANTTASRGGSHNPWVVLAVVIAGAFMQLVDVSIVNVAIPSIQRNLNATYAQIQLVLVFYQLAFACTLITGARLGDIYGRKKLFLIGLTLFVAASALCGAAPTATVLVIARLVQGVGGGMMFPQVLSVIQVTFPPAQRGKAFGVFGAAIGIATILGPLLGGALIQLNLFHTDWRMIFYVNLPIGVAALLGAIFQLGESKAPGAPRLDVWGALLITGGTLLVVYPITVGREKGWPLWIIGLLAAAVPVLALFAWYETRKTRRRDSPLLVMSLFKDRAFRAGILLLLVFFAALPPYFFLFSLYIQIGQGFTALGAGLAGFPFAVASGFASARSDVVARRLGNRVLAVGCALLVLGMLLVLLTVHLVGTHPHIYSFVVPLLVSGAGLGFFVAPVTNIVLAGIHAEGAGSASGVLSSVQQVGGALGVAVAGVIFFGLIGTNAANAGQQVGPALRAQLAAAHLPAPAVSGIIDGFQRCFDDRTHANDPTADPASCRAVERMALRSPAPPPVKQEIAVATGQAAKRALGLDFSRSFQQTLLYEVALFAAAFGLVFTLPPVDPQAMGHPAAAAPERADQRR